MGEKGNSERLYFGGLQNHSDGGCSHEIKRCLFLGKKSYEELSILKSRDITSLTKVHIVKAMVFPAVMCGCESGTIKNWCFQTTVLEKTPESPLECKEIEPVNPKENEPWIFTGRTDAEAPILRPPDVNSQFIGKDPEVGKDWRQEEKRETENEMVEWHH